MTTEDTQAIGEAAAGFIKANWAWDAVANEPDAAEKPEMSAYWHTREHLEFTLRRLGFLPPEGEGETAEMPEKPGR